MLKLFTKNNKGFIGLTLIIPIGFVALVLFGWLLFTAFMSQGTYTFEVRSSQFAENELNYVFTNYMDYKFDDMTMYDAISKYCYNDCSKIEGKTIEYFKNFGHFIDISVTDKSGNVKFEHRVVGKYSGTVSSESEIVVDVPTKSGDVKVKMRMPRYQPYEVLS